jgi:hypothetical protein
MRSDAQPDQLSPSISLRLDLGLGTGARISEAFLSGDFAMTRLWRSVFMSWRRHFALATSLALVATGPHRWVATGDSSGTVTDVSGLSDPWSLSYELHGACAIPT